MIISQISPSPGIESTALEFPETNYYGTGSYAFTVKAQTLQEPRLITTSGYKVPLFAIRVDLNAPAGELLTTIGPADNTSTELASLSRE